MKKILFLMLFTVSAGSIAYGKCAECRFEEQANKFNSKLKAMVESKSKADFVKNAKLCKKSSKGLSNSMSEDNSVHWGFGKEGVANLSDFFANLVNWIG